MEGCGIAALSFAFSLASFPNLLVTHLSAEERATACPILRARLAPLSGYLTSCGASP